MLNDTHMHCCFSGDSEANPEDMILAAIQKGLDGLCLRITLTMITRMIRNYSC